MGAFTSRQNAGVEEVDVASTHAYRYPPRSGNYFGSHFIMGGERFDTPQPESYLFGENSDLNFLGSRPTPFPYPPPQPNEPTKTLKSLVNIRKESLRFVRVSNDSNNSSENRNPELVGNTNFNIEFVFDCDVRCAITIYYFCTEEYTPNGVMYVPRDSSLSSETFHYLKGANQHFCQLSHVFNPAKFPEDDLLYDVDREMIPIAIHCVAEEGSEEIRQSHTTVATVEKISDGTYLLKALKQKLFVDGLCYLLQEIYGIENKNNDKVGPDDEMEDNGSECVICMCDVRDTLILPCRHLCLCNSCADSLRYQANNCPICRAPFRALLQIRALQKTSNPNVAPISPPDGSCDNIPPGYEAVSLIEALNGPCAPRQPPSAMPDLVETPENESSLASQAAQMLNNQCDRNSPTRARGHDSPILVTERAKDHNKESNKCPLLVHDKQTSPRLKHTIPRDCVKVVNEKTEKEEILDEDSEAEKYHPLLDKKETNTQTKLSVKMCDVVEPDDVDTDQEEHCTCSTKPNKNKTYSRKSESERGCGEESDYYTPEDPPTLGALCDGTGEGTSSMEGTPISHASAKSAAESSNSGSSTRQLLVSSGDKSVHI